METIGLAQDIQSHVDARRELRAPTITSHEVGVLRDIFEANSVNKMTRKDQIRFAKNMAGSGNHFNHLNL